MFNTYSLKVAVNIAGCEQTEIRVGFDELASETE